MQNVEILFIRHSLLFISKNIFQFIKQYVYWMNNLVCSWNLAYLYVDQYLNFDEPVMETWISIEILMKTFCPKDSSFCTIYKSYWPTYKGWYDIISLIIGWNKIGKKILKLLFIVQTILKIKQKILFFFCVNKPVVD
jgi:hypothetical protein